MTEAIYDPLIPAECDMAFCDNCKNASHHDGECEWTNFYKDGVIITLKICDNCLEGPLLHKKLSS